MAATPICSFLGAKAALDALLDLIDVGGAGYLRLYTGAAPANCETATSGTLLAELRFGATGFAAAAGASPNAVATANSITSDSSADNSGTAGYFRVFAGNGTTCILQGTCGTSSADMIMNTTTIVAGGQVACSSYTVTLPTGG